MGRDGGGLCTNRRVITGKLCIEVSSANKIAFLSEELCIGCGICVKKCPFEAIMIINLPKNLEKETSHRYGPNSFKLHRMPLPRPGQVRAAQQRVESPVGRERCRAGRQRQRLMHDSTTVGPSRLAVGSGAAVPHVRFCVVSKVSFENWAPWVPRLR